MKKLFASFLVLMSCSCEQKPNSVTISPNEPLEISIKSASSYEINLATYEYKVYYMTKPPSTIKFVLSSIDSERITSFYYSEGLNILPKKVEFKDECNIM